jgi:hypothetical protein|tara:strand:- start:11943 stop:12212 length:270 start_codon:yes stop_codon:yes gene_type:complete
MRLKALVGISYPDAASLGIVLKAGGLSKLDDEQLAKVKMRNVKPGGFCDDIPEASKKSFLKFGYIEKVGDKDASTETIAVTSRKSALKR